VLSIIEVYFTRVVWKSCMQDPGWDVYPESISRILILIFYPSRIQGSKRNPIPDSDPQTLVVCALERKEVFSEGYHGIQRKSTYPIFMVLFVKNFLN
jgi:hypothetical protein